MGVPLIIMLRYLRGDKVRSAVSERLNAGGHAKAKKFIIGLVAAVFIILISPLMYVFVIAGRFTSPPDVSDLEVERLDMPAEDNAFTHFTAAWEAGYEPEDRQIVRNFVQGEDVNEDVLLEVLAQNTEAIQYVRRGAECDVCIVPEYTYESELPYLRQWRYLGRILAAKSRYNWLEGNYEEAAEACVLLLNFGDLIMKDAEGVPNYLISIAIMRMGLGTALELARDPAMPEEEKTRLADALNALNPPARGLVRASKVEYRAFSDFIDRFPCKRSVWDENIHFHGFFDRLIRVFERIPYFFNRNRTKEIYANLWKGVIENAPLCYAGIEWDAIDPEEKFEGYIRGSLIRSNVIGETVVAVFVPAIRRMTEAKIQLECKIAATRLTVALNIYRRAEGRYPESLDALVPEYMESIPRDPYDCEPMRYDPELEVVYSVGENLEDNGGEAILKAGEYGDDWPWMRWEADDIPFLIGNYTE